MLVLYQDTKGETTMTYESNCTLPSELLTQIANEGLACLPELIRTLINTAMQVRTATAYRGGAV